MKKPFLGDFPISQKYGENPAVYAKFSLAGHEGVDWACPNGTPILASDNGTIVRRDFSAKDYGNFVVVWHKQANLATWYCHLQEAMVKVGDTVATGQQIGISDNTGNTTGPHLHFNICKTDANGYRIDKNNGYQGFENPLPFFSDPVNDQQVIIDQLRADRDKNWTLYQQERQAKINLEDQIDAKNKTIDAVVKENEGLKQKVEQAITDGATHQNALQGLTKALEAEKESVAQTKRDLEKTTLDLSLCRSQRKDLSKYSVKELRAELRTRTDCPWYVKVWL